MCDQTRMIADATLSKRAYGARMRRRRRMRALIAGASACFFVALLLLMAGVLIGRVPIREITVQGNAYYTEELLRKAVPVKRGDAIYRVDPDSVTKAMLHACPYLKTVELRATASGTLRVDVEERCARWALRYPEANGADRYVLLDEELIALEYAREAYVGCVVICEGLALPRIGESLTEAAAREDRALAAAGAGHAHPDADDPVYGKVADKLAAYLDVLLALYPDAQAGDAPIVLDLSQAYDQTLLLRGDCLYLLGNGLHLEEQILSARAAAFRYKNRQTTYRSKNKLIVDARSLSRVFVREDGEFY